MSMLEKRSVSLAGHRTSVSLEPEFWAALDGFASADGRSLAGLIAEVDDARARDGAAPARPLSSALRVYALARLAMR